MRTKRKWEMPTIWEVSDEAWALIERVLDEKYPRNPNDFRRVDLRRVLNGIIFRLRSGCQWNHLPREYGDDSTLHRHFQRWCERGVFKGIWAVLVRDCEELGAVDWEWQSADASMGKARWGGTRSGLTPPIGPRRVRRRASSSRPREDRLPS